MNTLLLHPNDVLFFRDGRPMGGSLSGHGAAWPLPTVVNHAFHAALHRAGEVFKDAHPHRRGRSSARPEDAERDRKFGSLTTAGPFPVKAVNGDESDRLWFFPRPLDAGLPAKANVSFRPLNQDFDRAHSSLPAPLAYPVANTHAPEKATLERWFSAKAFQSYLGTNTTLDAAVDFIHDSAFADTEFTYGIGIDSDTGTQDGERFYSASYLRLREDWRLGVLASAVDKIGDTRETRDLIPLLFASGGTEIIAGGQQRICRAVLNAHTDALPLPRGAAITGTQVKWILLTPAIFPAIKSHPGGWLPSWVDLNGEVQLLDGPGKNYARRHPGVEQGKPIGAKFVAAITGKPIPVAGYALPHEAAERSEGGPKPTHLAVPAGAVYYFTCDTPESAQALANALNWHGSDIAPSTIRNRRSTLMGEKGFGLGVCGTWEFHPGSVQSA